MKKWLFILMMVLKLPTFSYGQQCTTPVGGTLALTGNTNATMCTGSLLQLSLSGGEGDIQWQKNVGGAGFTDIQNFGSSSLSENAPQTATSVVYRVKRTCGSTDAFSNTVTITISSSSVGTVSPANTITCVGSPNITLTLTSAFGFLKSWERSINGGAYVVLGNSNLTQTHTNNQTGVFRYRYRVICAGGDEKVSNIATITVNNPTPAAVCDDPSELRRAVARVNVPGIPYAFSGFLVNSLANDGRLLFLTTSHPFNRYNPSASALASTTFTWNDDLNSCGGTPSTPTTSTGCTILATDGFITLLDLNPTNPPALPLLWYLGWDINPVQDFYTIFQSANNSIRKARINATSTFGTVSVSINNTTDAVTEIGGNNVLKFLSWTAGNPEKRGRGAPLISSTVYKARGVYIGGPEVNCDPNSVGFFADLSQAPTILNILRAGNSTATNSATVKMNYCIPSLELSDPLVTSETYQVSGFIKSTQDIAPNAIVRYKAGTFIELNPGFSSGNDFVAEIDPCVNNITVIAQKTDETEQANGEEKYEELNERTKWIVVYPTLLASGNSLTIETNEDVNGVVLQMYDLQGRHTKSFRLNDFVKGSSTTVPIDVPAGVYIIVGRNVDNFFNQKIVVQ